MTSDIPTADIPTAGLPTADIPTVIDEVWRADAPAILGVLTRRLGNLDRAEDALAEAITLALKRWPDDGVPNNPAGWLVTTAWRRALNMLRHEATGTAKLALLARLAALPDPEPVDEDRLALIFACCHSDLPAMAQLTLTLRAVCGLRTEEIAAAFLVPTATMAQRLLRSRRRLDERRISFDPPDPDDYPIRLASVLSVVYLLFNEGYLASGRAAPQRRDLTAEALRLARQLADLMPTEPEVAGLAALLEFNEARAATRFDAWGRLVLLEDQDRSRWNRQLIDAATARLGRAVARNRPGRYQLEAGIAAQHAHATSYHKTPWSNIRALYDQLDVVAPSPVARLSRAVATRYTAGPAEALSEVDALADRLSGYRLFHATRAEMLCALGRTADAHAASERALALATNPAERELLARRLVRSGTGA